MPSLLEDMEVLESIIFVFCLSLGLEIYLEFQTATYRVPSAHLRNWTDKDNYEDDDYDSDTSENEIENPCPICQRRLKYPAITNCKHQFCTSCVKKLWWNQINTKCTFSLKCPCCRAPVTYLTQGNWAEDMGHTWRKYLYRYKVSILRTFNMFQNGFLNDIFTIIALFKSTKTFLRRFLISLGMVFLVLISYPMFEYILTESQFQNMNKPVVKAVISGSAMFCAKLVIQVFYPY